MDIIIAAVGTIVTAVALWKPIFGDMENFSECIGYWLKPDTWSFLQGNYVEDWWAEMKLSLWVVSSCAVGYGLYNLVHSIGIVS